MVIINWFINRNFISFFLNPQSVSFDIYVTFQSEVIKTAEL